MGGVIHYDNVQIRTGMLVNREAPYFTVKVTSASAPFTYSFTPYITSGQSFWVDWGDGSEETYTTASTAEKGHEYSTPGTKTIRMLGSAGINRVRISPTDAGQAALVISSSGNLDKLGTITDTTDMFRDCPNLVMTELTGGITSIGSNTFRNCTSLALTSLPDGITVIGAQAFTGCTNLALTSLPANVNSIGVNAFYNCTNLALTSLPEGVTSIGTYAFYACKGLTNLIFLGTPTSIGATAFSASGVNLYVPWSSGAVADAPWGAASVTYDYPPVAKYYVTVTAGQTHTINSLGVSAATVVDWGDGLSNEYTGTAMRTHVYASAGTYEVKIYTPENVMTFDFRNEATVSVLNSADLKLMANVSTFIIYTLPNATITLNSADMVAWRPSVFSIYNLTSSTITLNSSDMADWRPSNFQLNNLPNATGTIDTADLVDWELSYFRLFSLPNATITLNSADLVDWRPSTFQLYNLPNATITISPNTVKNWSSVTTLAFRTGNLTQPQCDLILWECYQIARTVSGGTIDLAIAGNAAPSGVFQPCQSPPVSDTTPGKEIAYELLNDSLGVGFNKWSTVTTS